MMQTIPNDTILILTGIPCIGKTTTAYELARLYPTFQRVIEMDIVSDTVRAVFKRNFLGKECPALFESITVQDLDVTKSQASILLPYVKELVLRQQKRKLSTILEGAEIIPSLLFPDGKPVEWLNERIIFINLYISSVDEQRKRRFDRYLERKYPSEYDEIIRKEALVAQKKNEQLRAEAEKLAKNFPNVYNMDIENFPPSTLAEQIMKIVETYFSERKGTEYR